MYESCVRCPYYLLFIFIIIGVAKSQDLKVIADELPNPTDVEASLAQLRENDPKLKHLNLNNIKVCLQMTMDIEFEYFP